MRDSKDKFHSRVMKFSYLAVCSVLVLVGIANANGQNQSAKARVAKFNAEEVQQPLYREYRGVRLGMTAEETRAKLGSPVLKSDDLDYYVFSENETAQIAYNAVHKVVTISVDYTGGVGAPDYRTVVGAGVLERPDGSVYRMVHYKAEGFWVSYNKSAGTVPVVTVTLQVVAK
jgi:outer membrane protein assembly factor BamE (lipoprotein component of BamABCDE complex)